MTPLTRLANALVARRGLLLAICVAAVVAIGVIDQATGVRVALGPFYLVPIAIAAWFLGPRIGALVVAVSVTDSLIGDRLSKAPGSSGFIPWWNAGARLTVFMFIVFLVHRVSEAVARAQTSARLAEAAAERLRVADEIKNTFLNAASHELRTPLTAILGCAQTLQNLEGSLDAEDRRGLTRAVVANARKLDRLLGELLDLGRLSRGVAVADRGLVDLAKVAARVTEDLEILLDRPVHFDAESVPAMVDEAKVERILENLLRNAVKYTPPRSPIWVRVARQGEVPTLVVEDAGPGIDPALRERVFEPFERGEAHRREPGLGIGLALVKEFAALHGGRAWVEDRPGGGASFRVELPDGGLPRLDESSAASGARREPMPLQEVQAR